MDCRTLVSRNENLNCRAGFAGCFRYFCALFVEIEGDLSKECVNPCEALLDIFASLELSESLTARASSVFACLISHEVPALEE